MDWTLWAGFVAASLLVGLIPGPGVTTIVGYALSAGRGTAFAAVLGATLGNAVAMALSLGGAGVVLAQSALAFSILKWIGVIYLVGIGLYAIAAASSTEAGGPLEVAAIPPKTAFWGTFAVTALNPKTILFFIAFAPQFISPEFDYWTQAAILLVTFCLVVTISDGFYAFAASFAAIWLKGPEVRRWSQRAGGGVLVTAGIAIAIDKR